MWSINHDFVEVFFNDSCLLALVISAFMSACLGNPNSIHYRNNNKWNNWNHLRLMTKMLIQTSQPAKVSNLQSNVWVPSGYPWARHSTGSSISSKAACAVMERFCSPRLWALTVYHLLAKECKVSLTKHSSGVWTYSKSCPWVGAFTMGVSLWSSRF